LGGQLASVLPQQIERCVGLAILDREPLPPMLNTFLDCSREAKLPAL
jgi:hypothetical protein